MNAPGHLLRRWAGSLSKREPSHLDSAWAESMLLPAEVTLWRRMTAADRRHAVVVARRFMAMGQWSREEIAAALLHDVGKVVSQLGTTARVIATVVGPRTERFRQYHDHEALGAAMLREAGSSPVTVDLVRGVGRAHVLLRRADDV
jgi:hypothetical protein